jgi:hypothetical protein
MPPGEPPASAPAATRGRRRLNPSARRLVEVCALLILLPVTLGLRWYDDDHTLGHQLRRDERIVTVPRGASGTLAHAAWRMIGRQVGSAQELRDPAPGTAVLVLALEVRPLDAEGVKQISAGQLTFRLRDRAGHVWTGSGTLPDSSQVGRAARVEVSATVPSDKVTSVVLDVLPSLLVMKPGTDVPVLRFGH